MKGPSSANWEMGVVLPLGVVAVQLLKIEASLRLLNVKALELSRSNESSRVAGDVASNLERIHEVLDSLKALVVNIDLELSGPAAASRPTRPDSSQDATDPLKVDYGRDADAGVWTSRAPPGRED